MFCVTMIHIYYKSHVISLHVSCPRLCFHSAIVPVLKHVLLKHLVPDIQLKLLKGNSFVFKLNLIPVNSIKQASLKQILIFAENIQTVLKSLIHTRKHMMCCVYTFDPVLIYIYIERE